jgi:hypothetical protein
MAALLGLSVFACSTTPSPKTSSACRTEEPEASAVVADLRDVAADSMGDERRGLGLPAAGPTEVYLVREEAICQTAASRFLAHPLVARTGVTTARVYVIRYGTVFLVRDPDIRPSNRVVTVVLDSTFRRIDSWISF